jgi:hypothetical protein
MNAKKYFVIACLLLSLSAKSSGEDEGAIAVLDQRKILSTFLSQQGKGFQGYFNELQATSKQEIRRNSRFFGWDKSKADVTFAQSMGTLRTKQLDPTTVDNLMASLRVFNDEREKQEARERAEGIANREF